MTKIEARNALNEVAAAERRLAGRATWSLPRHASVGFVLGSIVASAALPPAGMIFGTAICSILTLTVFARDRARDGFFINGYQAGRTRWVALGIAVLSVSMLLLGLYSKANFGWWYAPLICGVATFVIATGGSILWEKIYLRDLMRRQ